MRSWDADLATTLSTCTITVWLVNMKGLTKHAGPASYLVPQIVGHKRIASGHPSCPSYSFPKQLTGTSVKMASVSKELSRHIMPYDVPGVGTYDPKAGKLRRKSPNAVIPTAERFPPDSNLGKYKRTVYSLPRFE